MNRSTLFSIDLRSSAALGLAVFLLGCTVGPDYQKPETVVPENWISAQDQQTANDQTAIDQTWWQHFNDPVLTQLITKASTGNLDLKIAETRIDAARASRASASSALWPQGDVKASGVREANQLAFPDMSASGLGTLLKKPFNTFETGFDASWELDLFGGHRRDIEAATATLEATEASRDDMKVSLLAEVARTYMDIRLYQAQLAIAEDMIHADKNTLDIARQRFDAGETASLDVTQAEALLEQAQTQLPYYRNLLAQAEYSLDVLLGEQPGAAHALVGSTGAIPASDKKIVLMAPAAVIAHRPDIRVAERKLAAATAQQGVAVAQFFPDISLSGFVGLLNTNASSLLQAGSKSWMVGGNVLWPILSYGKLSANLDSANAGQQEALATYQKTMISALSDVERSVTAYTEQEKYRQSLMKAVADNRHASKISQERYKEGLTSFLEVLDAERTLYNSQNQLTDASARTSENMVAVYKSLGGGWAPPAQ